MRKNNRHLLSYISWILLFTLVFTYTAALCTVVKASETKEDSSDVVEFNEDNIYVQDDIEEREESVTVENEEESDVENDSIQPNLPKILYKGRH